MAYCCHCVFYSGSCLRMFYKLEWKIKHLSWLSTVKILIHSTSACDKSKIKGKAISTTLDTPQLKLMYHVCINKAYGGDFDDQ